MSTSTLRPLLFAGAIGAAAPVVNALAIGIAISLSYSALFMFGHGDPAARLELGARLAERIQGSAPVVSTLLLFGGALLVGRRLSRAPHAAALAVACAGFTVGTIIAVGFGATLSSMTAVYLGVDLAVAELGVALGFDRSRAVRALDEATRALRQARSETELVEAIHTSYRSVGIERASIHRVEPGRVLVRTAAAPPAARQTAETLDLFCRADLRDLLDRGEPIRLSGPAAVLWLPLLREGRCFAALELCATAKAVIAERRSPLWNALGAQVALALANLDLLEQVRVAASREERQQLSADIHDTLAQNLISAVVHLEAAQRKRGDDRPIDEHVSAALAAVREGLGHARGLVWSSRDRDAREPVNDALARAVADFEAQSGIATGFCTVGDPIPLGADGERLLLRAAREGLQNVRKHACASQVRVTLTYMDGSAALDITDDGQGEGGERPVAPAGLGFGLPALRDQAEALGGTIAIESEATSGTTLTLQLPVTSSRAP